MRRRVYLCCLLLTGCMKPVTTPPYKSSKLKVYLDAFQSGGSVVCAGSASLADDPSGTLIQLENDAFFTCNKNVMTSFGTYSTYALPYVPGQYTVSLIRRVDGAAFSQTFTIP